MRKLLFIFLLLAALTLGVRGYNTWIQVEEIPVVSACLPEEFDGFRVLLLSDLHGERNDDLLRAARAARPDLIALCGDLVDSADQIGAMSALCAELGAIAPCCFVTGNHEWAALCVNDLLKALGEAGVTVLDDGYVLLEENGETIVLAGFCDPNGFTDRTAQKKMLETVRQEHGEKYILLLNHRNESPDVLEALGVQTVLSGHGHGGVIRLPFIGGLLDTDRSFFPQYTSGLYTSGQTSLVVSRGLGGTRILCRPHLPVVILRSEK